MSKDLQLTLIGQDKELTNFVKEQEIEQYIESTELYKDGTAEYILTKKGYELNSMQ